MKVELYFQLMFWLKSALLYSQVVEINTRRMVDLGAFRTRKEKHTGAQLADLTHDLHQHHDSAPILTVVKHQLHELPTCKASQWTCCTSEALRLHDDRLQGCLLLSADVTICPC